MKFCLDELNNTREHIQFARYSGRDRKMMKFIEGYRRRNEIQQRKIGAGMKFVERKEAPESKITENQEQTRRRNHENEMGESFGRGRRRRSLRDR